MSVYLLPSGSSRPEGCRLGAPPGRVLGSLLAGGVSRRFGRNKALIRVGGVPLLELAAASIAPCAEELSLAVKEPGPYRRFGYPLITDSSPVPSPLSGIVSAAGRIGRGEWLLLSACDIVILDGRLLQRLARMREEGKAAVFSLNGRPQPFPGFYPAELLAGFVEALEQGLMKLTPIVRAMPRRELPLDGEDAPNGTGLVNVNRPEDLHLLEQLVFTGREAAAAEE